MEKTTKYCQSCLFPLDSEEVYGTTSDGKKCEDYCIHCFEKGVFTLECSMNEMIDFCVPYYAKESGEKEEIVKDRFNKIFPTLKRWKQFKVLFKINSLNSQ